MPARRLFLGLELDIDAAGHLRDQCAGALGAGGVQHLEESIEKLLVKSLLTLRVAELFVVLAPEELPDPWPCEGRIEGSKLHR